MPDPNAPRPEAHESMLLDMDAPLNPNVAKLLIVVLWNNKRLHCRVEEHSSTGEVLDAKHSRMGLTLWRSIALPSFRLYAKTVGLDFEVREVLSHKSLDGG